MFVISLFFNSFALINYYMTSVMSALVHGVDLSPRVEDEVICDWWLPINTLIPGHSKSRVKSLITLLAWMIKQVGVG